MKRTNLFYHFLFLVSASQLCWAQPLKTGIYVNEKDPESYFELKVRVDSSFYFGPSRSIGKYHVKRDSLILMTEEGYPIAFQAKADFLLDSQGKKWVLWRGGNTRSGYVKERGLWLEIRPGQTEEALTLTQRGEVIFGGKKLGEFSSFDPSAAAVLLSPSSPSKKLILCMFWDRDKGAMDAYILGMKNKRVLTRLEITTGMKWVSWSPDEKAALIASYYEADMRLYAIDLTREVVFMFKETLKDLGAQAYQYRIRPPQMGGGSGSYSGFTIYGKSSYEIEGAIYSIQRATSNQIVFRAVSKTDPTKTGTATFDANGTWVDKISATSPITINLAKEGEEQRFDLDGLRWTDSKNFQFRVTIHCNPYTNENCNDENRRKVIRAYDTRVNVSTLGITYKRLD